MRGLGQPEQGEQVVEFVDEVELDAARALLRGVRAAVVRSGTPLGQIRRADGARAVHLVQRHELGEEPVDARVADGTRHIELTFIGVRRERVVVQRLREDRLFNEEEVRLVPDRRERLRVQLRWIGDEDHVVAANAVRRGKAISDKRAGCRVEIVELARLDDVRCHVDAALRHNGMDVPQMPLSDRPQTYDANIHIDFTRLLFRSYPRRRGYARPRRTCMAACRPSARSRRTPESRRHTRSR